MSVLTLVGSVLFGIAIFYVYQWLATSSTVSKMTENERFQAEVDEFRQRHDQTTWRGRLNAFLLSLGLNEGSRLPFFAWLLLDLAAVAALEALGVTGVAGVLLSVLVSGGIVVMVLTRLAGRRRLALNRQLVQALSLLATQLEGGTGPNAALRLVLESMPDPLHTELGAALEASGTSDDPAEAFRLLGEKYPTRAVKLVTSAFEINRDEGGPIAPAIRQAATSLMRDRELNEETLAEISQSRAEFWGIVSIIGGIAIVEFAIQNSSTLHPFHNAVAIVFLVLGVANFIFGVVRGLRIFTKARGSI